MKEIADIIRAFDQACAEGKQMALATVVHLEGSSYRRPGARMLITEDGQMTGAISGGCLEGDALQKAQLVMARNQASVITYNTMDDDDSALAIGLGCNGIIRILMEPLERNGDNHQINFLRKITDRRNPAILVTIFNAEERKTFQTGTCLMMDESGETISVMEETSLQQIIEQDCREALEVRKSLFKKYIGTEKDQTAFIEFIQPPVSLVIFGAGNDVIPLAKQAEILGWPCQIIDGRSSHARKERFTASCQVRVSKPESAFKDLVIDDRTAVLLMTHNFHYDKAILSLLLSRQVSYIGMLGPGKKLDRMLQELTDEGVSVSDNMRGIIHSPVGLDIGAETPEEIAVSIIAEIQTHFHKASAQPLKKRSNEIHPRMDTRIEERKLN